jgi:hypothetical protein
MKSLKNLLIHVKDAEYFLQQVRLFVDLEPDEITQADLTDGRNELTNASNAIDDAMGEIDKLLAPDLEPNI